MNAPFATPIRTAPHNIEAEQALLGAMLVNNEAFYRVSDFLEPKHFLEGIHQRIYEIAGGFIRAGKLRRGLDLLVIDYVQLLQGTKHRNRDNRVQEITEITTSLKALAKELNIPILALSQLSRQVEQRDDKRPLLSDLRESGSIEQDADVVLFVFREAYYHAMQKPVDNDQKMYAWAARAEELHNLAEIIIAKHRHGPLATVELMFESDLTRFLCVERRCATR
jgi:replicative DNA helicase